MHPDRFEHEYDPGPSRGRHRRCSRPTSGHRIPVDKASAELDVPGSWTVNSTTAIRCSPTPSGPRG